MELKYRKAIANGALSDDVMQKLKIQNMSTNPGGALNFTGGLEPKLTTSASGLGSLGSGGMGSLAEKDPTKFFGLDGASGAAKPGGAGAFLKNNASGIANAAMSAIDFVGTIGDISKNKISSDEMMGSGGTTQQNINGVGYTEERIDEAGIQRQIDATAGAATMSGIKSGGSLGAAAGSLFGPVGGAIGGVAGSIIGGVAGFFGGGSAKEEAERQLRIARNRTQDANSQRKNVAYTIGLRNQFNRENETDTSQSLFHAEKGKEGAVNPMTMETYKKHIVNTAYGKMFAPQNAWVSDGEVIKSADGSLHRVKGGKNDTARAYLQAGDSVYSKKVINPETGNSIADDAASYAMAGQLDRLDMNQNVGRMLQYAGKRKGDVLPGYLGGTNKIWDTVKNIGQNLDLENVIPTVTAFTTAAQRDAQTEGGLRAPKSFVANPYENDALQQLNSLHSDYYPVWTQNRELEARGKSAIAQSGGLSAGQRMLGYMGLANKTQQNNAAALFEHQSRENALRAQAANAALQAGNQSATRQQQAYQWDEDMLAKAHAARLNMWETSAYDRQNALTQYFKNRWEKNQFDRTMNLYESQQENDRAKTQAIINSLGTKNTPVTLTGVEGNASMAAIDPATGKLVRTNPFSASQLLSEDAKKSIGNQNNIVSTAANAINGANTSAAPKIKRPEVSKPSSKKNATRKKITLTKDSMGQQFANVVTTPQKKNKPVTTKAEEKKSAKPVEKYTPIPFGNAALQERFPDASEEAKKDRPFKERAGRPAATTNSEQRRRAVEWFILGKKRYEEKYGKD